MSIKTRQQRVFKKKTSYIFLLALCALLSFLVYSIFFSRNVLFISPLGRTNTDRSNIEKLLRNNNILFSQVLVLSDSSYEVTIANNGQVKLSSKKNINRQISSLQRILRELTIEGKPFKSIDFRFDEPIISF